MINSKKTSNRFINKNIVISSGWNVKMKLDVNWYNKFMTTFTVDQAKQIGEQLGVNWSRFDVEQFRMGMDVELEHGLRDPKTNVTNDDPLMTGKIALAHLNEMPDYYTRLKMMEDEGKKA